MIRNPREKEVLITKQEGCISDNKALRNLGRQTALKNPRIVHASRSLGGKDRHSKVKTIRGLRDRRVRLSAPTAIQLYDLQEKLGLNQPSKVMDWLLNAAQHEINKLPPLPVPLENFVQCPQNVVNSHGITSPGAMSPEYNNGLSSTMANSGMFKNNNLGGACSPLSKFTYVRTKQGGAVKEVSTTRGNYIIKGNDEQTQGVNLMNGDMPSTPYYPSELYNAYPSHSGSPVPHNHRSGSMPSMFSSSVTASTNFGTKQYNQYPIPMLSSASQIYEDSEDTHGYNMASFI